MIIFKRFCINSNFVQFDSLKSVQKAFLFQIRLGGFVWQKHLFPPVAWEEELSRIRVISFGHLGAFTETG